MNKKTFLVPCIGFLATALALSGCSKEGDIADNSPGGEIRLTSGVQVQSRAGTAPDTQIANGERVAVYVDEATSPAAQLYGNNVLTADGNGGFSGGTAMYFPASGKNVDIYAFHTNATLAEAFPTSIEHSVAADQTGGYASSDLLYAARTGVKHTTSAVDLTFHHLLSKVDVTLTPGKGLKDTDLEGAVITIENTRLKATFTPDKTAAVADQSARAAMVKPAESNNDVASIKILTATASNLSASAVIVPQTLATGTKFIKVTLANGNKLSYKLTAETTFGSGKRHQYAITVNLAELTVTSGIDNWNPVGSVYDEATMPDPIGNKLPAQAAVGDFYMSDGTLVGKDEKLTDVQQSACIGIVYSTDASRIGEAATQALKAKGVDSPHGLVMALTNASDGCKWGKYDKDENSGGGTGEPFKENSDQLQKKYRNIDGYGETRWIIDTYKNSGTTLQDTYSAFYHASRYGTADSNTDKYATPSNTTGWFIPSMGQWWDILSNLGGIDLSSCRDKTDSYTSISSAAPIAVNNMNQYLEKINGAMKFSMKTFFWSSSEMADIYACYACYVGFSRGDYLVLSDANKHDKGRVRCSFAF